MSSQNGLDTLARQTPLTKVEWAERLEKAVRRVAPIISETSLAVELGKLSCMRNGNGAMLSHILNADFPDVTGEPRYSLETKGVFFIQKPEKYHTFPGTGYQPVRESGYTTYPNGTKWVGGLTSEGDWLLIRISFVGEPGYKDRGKETARNVYISSCLVEEFVKEVGYTYHDIWKRLEVIHDVWFDVKKGELQAELDRMKEDRAAFAIESHLLSLIPQ